jgi:hypothetical protein
MNSVKDNRDVCALWGEFQYIYITPGNYIVITREAFNLEHQHN